MKRLFDTDCCESVPGRPHDSVRSYRQLVTVISMSHTRALPVTARESQRRRRCTPSARGVSDATLFTPGVNRVHFHSTCHGFMPVRVERSVTQSPKLIRKHWGPSRRDAPHGAYSTPAPATRDGVTVRPIQPRRRASLATVATRRGRPMARPVSGRRQMAAGRPVRYRALYERTPRSCRT